MEVPTDPGYALAVVASKLCSRRELRRILSHGRRSGGARGGLQGSRAGQNSTAYLEQIVEFPVPQDRREGGGGLQGSLPVKNSAAVAEQIVGIPARRGLSDFLPGQGSSASSSSRLHDDADEDFTNVFRTFPRSKKSAKLGSHSGSELLIHAAGDPKISSLSRPPLRPVLPVPQTAEQLVDVHVPVPSFSDWVRWEEKYRRTGPAWLGGFEWRLSASPARFSNTGSGRRRRPWYRAASVPAHRQSGGDPWLRLSRQVRPVQTVQFWGVRGELQRQVPAVPHRL